MPAPLLPWILGLGAAGAVAYYYKDKIPGLAPAPGVPGGTPGVPPPSKLPAPSTAGGARKTVSYATWAANSLNALGLGDPTFPGAVTVPASPTNPAYMKAVVWFEKKNGLKVDSGIVGPQVEAALIAALSAAGVAQVPGQGLPPSA